MFYALLSIVVLGGAMYLNRECWRDSKAVPKGAAFLRFQPPIITPMFPWRATRMRPQRNR